jgi:AraC-like DNA-binding protein
MPLLTKHLIYKSVNSLLIVGNEIAAKAHSHHALQISISLDQPFLFECDEASGEFQGVIIDADISHSLYGVKGCYALLLLDPELLQAKRILKYYSNDKGFSEIEESTLEPVRRFINLLLSNQDVITDPIERLMSILSHNMSSQKIEPRITSLINYIEQKEHKMANIGELAQQVQLSPSRLAHLFKQEVGIPIRRYLLWQRLLDACTYASVHGHTDSSGNIIINVSLTDAAHQAGFTDSSHFSRTFKSMFGIHPSNVIKNSHLIITEE